MDGMGMGKAMHDRHALQEEQGRRQQQQIGRPHGLVQEQHRDQQPQRRITHTGLQPKGAELGAEAARVVEQRLPPAPDKQGQQELEIEGRGEHPRHPAGNPGHHRLAHGGINNTALYQAPTHRFQQLHPIGSRVRRLHVNPHHDHQTDQGGRLNRQRQRPRPAQHHAQSPDGQPQDQHETDDR